MGVPQYNSPGVNGSVCHAGQQIKHTTNLQSGPTNGDVVSTPLPIKYLSLASPGFKSKGRMRRADVPAFSSGTDLA